MPDCPDSDSLQRLLAGQMPDPQCSELGEHLLACDRCAALAETLNLDDDLTTALRSPPQIQEHDPALAQAMAGSKQLWSAASVADHGDTKSLDAAHDTSHQDLSLPDSAAVLAAAKQFLASVQSDEEIGRLGNYRVLQLIGSGGMGIVFRAEDLKLERQVALKVLRPELAASSVAKERFLQEAKAAAAIEHDHIVHIYQVGEDRGLPFIAMQYLRGESLHARLQREGSLPQDDLLRIGREIAAGLSAAHDHGLVHRDIKPHNIWLQKQASASEADDASSSPRVKILDFGLVRSIEAGASLTHSGVVLGTPRYMAPEQAKGDPIDSRTDLFSLGSVMYHLATGRPPFAGDNVPAVLMAVANMPPVPLAELVPNFDTDLVQLIMSLLQKDPDAWPRSAAEVVAHLKQIDRRLSRQSYDPALLAETTKIDSPLRQARARGSLLRTRLLVGMGIFLLVGVCFLALWQAGLLFNVQTEHGTLIVKLTDDRFTAEVLGQTITIQNTKTAQRYTIELDAPQTSKPNLPLGEYRFLLTTDSGLKTRTDRFTLNDRELQQQVEVWWQPLEQEAAAPDSIASEVPQTAAVDPHDPERLLALVLSSPVSVNEFERPNINLFANNSGMLREIHSHQHFVTCPKEFTSRGHWAWPILNTQCTIIDVAGRVIDGEHDGRNPTAWIVLLHDQEDPYAGITFKVAEKRVTYHESIFDNRAASGPPRGDILLTEPIKAGEFHRLQLVLTDDRQQVTPYLDGVRLCDPIELDHPMAMMGFSLGIHHADRGQGGSVAFERYALYHSPEQQTPDANESQ